MKNHRKLILITVVASSLAFSAFAESPCYVDYKAKQYSAELRLHYGVMQLSGSACSNPQVLESVVSSRIAVGNWSLLRILSRFDKSGLNQRRDDAGKYFLKY